MRENTSTDSAEPYVILRTVRESDLPLLLRRVADHIEAHGIVPGDILDLAASSEITAEVPVWLATVYWSPDEQLPGPVPDDLFDQRVDGPAAENPRRLGRRQ